MSPAFELAMVGAPEELASIHDGDELASNSMAEAFARKSWGEGFYRIIGGRQTVQTIVEYGLFGVNIQKGQIGIYPGMPYEQKFSQYMVTSGMAGVGSVAYSLTRNVLYSGGWNRVLEERPYEWGNLVAESSEEFRRWINWTAPMLATGEVGINGNPDIAIWYAYGRGGESDQLRIDTLYFVTKGQSNLLPILFPGGTGLEDG